MAAENGMSEDDIAQLVQGNKGFTGNDLIILDVDQLLAEGHPDWATWQRLVNSVGERRAWN